MATVNHTVVETPYASYVKVFKWVLTSGDVGDVVMIPHLQGDKTFMVIGNFTGGGVVTIEGTLSPDEATTVQLKNLQGDDLSFAAADIEAVAPACYGYKPVASTITSVTVYLFAR